MQTIVTPAVLSEATPAVEAVLPAEPPTPPQNRTTHIIAAAVVLLIVGGSTLWTATRSKAPSSELQMTTSTAPAVVPLTPPAPSPGPLSAAAEHASKNVPPEPVLGSIPELLSEAPPTAAPKPKSSESHPSTAVKKSSSTKGSGNTAASPPLSPTALPPPPPTVLPPPPLAVLPPPPPTAEAYTNMSLLKTALREGRITKLQYRSHQAEIRQRRAAEYERLNADYRRGAITRDEYERRVRQVRQKYEGE